MQQMTGAQIYDNFMTGPGTRGLTDAQSILERLEKEDSEIGDDVASAASSLEESWQGDAAGAAQRGAGPLAVDHSVTSEHTYTAHDLIRQQVEAFDYAKANVVPVPSVSDSPPTPMEAATDPDAQMYLVQKQLALNAQEQNVRVMRIWDDSSTHNGQMMPTQYGNDIDSTFQQVAPDAGTRPTVDASGANAPETGPTGATTASSTTGTPSSPGATGHPSGPAPSSPHPSGPPLSESANRPGAGPGAGPGSGHSGLSATRASSAPAAAASNAPRRPVLPQAPAARTATPGVPGGGVGGAPTAGRPGFGPGAGPVRGGPMGAGVRGGGPAGAGPRGGVSGVAGPPPGGRPGGAVPPGGAAGGAGPRGGVVGGPGGGQPGRPAGGPPGPQAGRTTGSQPGAGQQNRMGPGPAAAARGGGPGMMGGAGGRGKGDDDRERKSKFTNTEQFDDGLQREADEHGERTIDEQSGLTVVQPVIGENKPPKPVAPPVYQPLPDPEQVQGEPGPGPKPAETPDEKPRMVTLRPSNPYAPQPVEPPRHD